MDDIAGASPLDTHARALEEVSVLTSGGVALSPLTLRGQINLRLGDDRGHSAGRVQAGLGVALPREPNRVSASETVTVAWLGPDEWLIFCAWEAVPSLESKLAAALEGHWGSVVDVSANRIGISISGAHARDALLTCCTLDLRPERFPLDRCAQTLIGRVVVLLHHRSRDTFDLWVRPSFGRYLARLLIDAGAPGAASTLELTAETTL